MRRHQRLGLLNAVGVVAALVLGTSGCAQSAISAATAPSGRQPEPEPTTTTTTTYVPTPRPAPLWDLLRIHADHDSYSSVDQQLRKPDLVGVVLGRVETISLGGVTDIGGSDTFRATEETVYLGVRPSRVTGKVEPDPDGRVYVETYKPPMVTKEWLNQATGYDKEAVFVLSKWQMGKKRSPKATSTPVHTARGKALGVAAVVPTS